MARHHPFLMPLPSATGIHQIYELPYPFVSAPRYSVKIVFDLSQA
jgi:hypothetical protein